MAVASPDFPVDDDQRAAALDLLVTMTHADEATAERLGAAGAVETALHRLEGADAPRPIARSMSSSLDASMYGAVVTAEPGDTRDEGQTGELGDRSTRPAVGIHPTTSEDPVKLAAASLLAALCDGWAGNRKILRRAGRRRDPSILCRRGDGDGPRGSHSAERRGRLRHVAVPRARHQELRALRRRRRTLAQLLNLLLACTPTLRPVVVSTLADIQRIPRRISSSTSGGQRGAGTRSFPRAVRASP